MFKYAKYSPSSVHGFLRCFFMSNACLHQPPRQCRGQLFANSEKLVWCKHLLAYGFSRSRNQSINALSNQSKIPLAAIPIATERKVETRCASSRLLRHFSANQCIPHFGQMLALRSIGSPQLEHWEKISTLMGLLLLTPLVTCGAAGSACEAHLRRE